jgi:hypothetical protein
MREDAELPPDGELGADALSAWKERRLNDEIDAALPKGNDLDGEWSIQELRRLALMGRLTGDISGAVSAHRVLADAIGALRGGYGDKRKHDGDLTDEEAERAILEAAAAIKARRKKPT